jgi:Ca2+-binding RTX toxin-like protein
MQPKLLLPLAAVAAVFAVPAAANAAVTVTADANAKTVTFAGDAAADNITLGVNAAGNITHTANGAPSDDFGGGKKFANDGALVVTVNAGDGNDNINLSGANIAKSVINGEAGDDIIVGGDDTDTISGGDGNDRITGFKNTANDPTFETTNGDAGNDVLIWNNGDGSDTDDGGAGNDTTLVTTGTANDDMVVNSPVGDTTRFHRNNAPFDVDMKGIERLEITSFSGNDTLVTQAGVTVAMTIDAGSGDDTITTGEGNDLINGNDGNDTLNGSGGGDRIVGDRGNDTMNGGEGADTLVWNNGDGSDVINGDGGSDIVEDNLGAGVDVSTLKNDGARVRYDRTNVGQFNLSMATVELLNLNTLAGDDTVDVSPDVALPVNVNAGDGNDTLHLRGVSADTIRGGAGTDSAVVDALDGVAEVESVDRPAVPQPLPSPAAGKASMAKTAKVKKGVASIKLTCPAGTSGCSGTLLLFSSKSIKAGPFSGRALLGRKAYAIAAGQTKTIKVKLAKGTAKLAKKKKLVATAEGKGKVTLRF